MPNGKKQNKQNALAQIVSALDNTHIGIGKERDYFVENLSMLVASGMTIVSAISAVEQEVHSRSMKKILAALKDDIEGGSPLWRAFQRSGVFRDHTISLVRAGEESGKLSENLKLIAVQEEKDRAFRSKIRSAMMYPVFVLSLTVIIGVGIAWFILPKLATVFDQLHIQLPLITKVLIGIGKFLGAYGFIAFPVFFVCAGFLIYFIFYFPKTKFIGQGLLFSLPGINRLVREIELARFGYMLGTLLEAGIPITSALDSLYKAADFPRYKNLYAHLGGSIEDGNSFQKSFANYNKANKLVPVPIQQLIVAGEQSGNLSGALLRISAHFEAKTEDTTKNLTVILEPVLLVIVWLGVVSVALAVILPIYGLIGGLNTEPSQGAQAPPQQVVEVPAPTTLKILSEGVSSLRIRDGASIVGNIIGRALPKETYVYTNEENGWYEIVLPENKSGWVLGNYVEIIKAQ